MTERGENLSSSRALSYVSLNGGAQEMWRSRAKARKKTMGAFPFEDIVIALFGSRFFLFLLLLHITETLHCPIFCLSLAAPTG